MKSAIEAIRKRYSVRTYSSASIEEEKKSILKEYTASNNKGPFGNKVRFQIVDAEGYDIEELKKLGTYGIIKGARVFIAGAVKKGERAMEDFGYSMEKNILMATELGLGTVWLGGYLNRSTFALKIGAQEDELIPAVTPVGYASDKRSVMDRFIAFAAGSRNRKEFSELFFNGDTSTALDSKECGEYEEVLESVRLAPSASNKQPWRIIKERDKDTFHIYLKENPLYNNTFKDIKIQNVDMGIAMSHFELSALNLGLKGNWIFEEPDLNPGDLKYIGSWVG